MRVIWRDPPAADAPVRRSYSHPWVDRLEPLMERPGTWAFIESYRFAELARGAERRLSRGQVVIPPGAWEFVVRRTADGGGDLYARFLGLDQEQAS